MEPREALRVPTILDVVPLAGKPDVLDGLDCASCGGRLNLHHPDAASPERFIGICPACDRWALVQAGIGGGEAAMVLLPGAGWFGTLPRAGWSNGESTSHEPG